MTPEPSRIPARPHLPDRDAWVSLVAVTQAAARAQHGMAVLTLRLAVENGLLVGWCEPTVQRWHSGADSWLAGQNVNLYEEGGE